jgi:hypothetical protein
VFGDKALAQVAQDRDGVTEHLTVTMKHLSDMPRQPARLGSPPGTMTPGGRRQRGHALARLFGSHILLRSNLLHIRQWTCAERPGSLTVGVTTATVRWLGVTEGAGAGEGGNPMPDTKSDREVEVSDREVEVVEVSRKEGRDMLDRAAREVLNISGDEFLDRWDAGEYEDADDPAVTRVAMLIPFAR